MTWRTTVFTGLNAALFAATIWMSTTHAQRPPDADQEGVQYLKVNINPTAEPPLVNINPYGVIPQVDVARMPQVQVPPGPCDDPTHFESGAARSVSGPIKLTFFAMNQPGKMTFVDGAGGSHEFSFNSSNAFGSVIQLKAGESLEFDSEVLYSGCRVG